VVGTSEISWLSGPLLEFSHQPSPSPTQLARDCRKLPDERDLPPCWGASRSPDSSPATSLPALPHWAFWGMVGLCQPGRGVDRKRGEERQRRVVEEG